MFPSFGLGSTSENTARPSPAASRMSSACAVIGRLASALSVTSSGFFSPTALQCSASSEMRPAPNFTAVG